MSADAAPDQPLRLARLVEMSPAAAAAAATLQTVAAKRSTSEDSRWKSVLEAQIQAIVSISFLTPRTFDVWSPGSFTATGFVVHLEETRGIVMTNKHVTTDAPWIGRLQFRNGEECTCHPIWRDPIHDFGFLSFDPRQILYQPLHPIKLAPEEAELGLDIRVPGSDAGEKLAILSGTIARLDRPAPNYGVGSYCDWDTFVIQASSNTSGGSSGSPVLALSGNAVALNAGGATNAASSFFLPLERPLRALNLLIQNLPVSRGTIQTEFIQRAYDDCRRMGLPREIEQRMREIGHGDELSGLLSVRHVVPLGPADGYLQTGDILVSIDGKLCNHFVELEAVLDDKAELLAKGEQPTVVLTVFRHRQFVEIEIEVEDLHTITPSSYLELGGSIIHPLSFQLARAYLHPVNSVFIADPGTVFGLAGVPAYSVVTALNNEPTPDLETFIKVLQQLPDSKRVPVRFYSLSKKGVENVRVVTIDKRSTRFRMATRDDSKGTWIYTPIPSLPLDSASATAAAPARFIPLPTSSRGSTYGRVASKLQRSFCTVEWTSPFGMDGLTTKWSDGCGIVVDSVNGIVLVDRATIPTAMGRVSLTFANNLTVPGRILWICPIQNFGFLQYDPESVRGKIRPEPAGVEFSELGPMRPGDEVLLATINTTTHAIRVLETDIKSRGFFLYQDQHPPKYRTINLDEAATLHRAIEEQGLIVDKQGRARGAWMQYPESTSSFNGLDLSPDSLVRSVLEGIRTSLRDGTELPSLRVVDCEWTESYVHKCRDLGLDEKWISRILASRTRRPVTASLDDNGQVEDLDRELEALSMEAYDSADESDVEDSTDPHAEILTPKYAVVTVRRVPAWPVTSGTGYPGVAAETSTLREGDLILTINDRLVAHMRDLMQVVSTSSSEAAKPVTLRVFRDGAERLLTVPTRILSGVPQPEVVQWAGALFQPPHRAIQFHTKYIPRGVYTSLLYSGSPAQRDGISASWFLVEVDGKPVHDLKSLLEAVEDVEGAAKVPVVDPIGKEGWSKADAEEKEDQSEDKIWETRSYRVKMVSLELVQKVVTVEICRASRTFWPTFHAKVSPLSDGSVAKL